MPVSLVLPFPASNSPAYGYIRPSLPRAAISHSCSVVTRSQNNWNRRPNKGHRYKGVYPHARGWHARIRYLNKRLHLGYFDEAVTAARVYDAAALHLFGHFARPNFPDEPVSLEAEAQLLRILERHSLV
jgi:hypothetical protein